MEDGFDMAQYSGNNSQNQYLMSGSEESLSKYMNETMERYPKSYSRFNERQPSPTYFERRRRSSSPLQDDVFRQVQQLHIDPRYRDTRPIARSSSNLALAEANSFRWDVTPSIYIEQYNDENIIDGNSNESLNNTTSYTNAHQPLNEDSMASCADSDDIPFIDDGSPGDDYVYIPPNVVVPINSTKPGIMVDKSSSSRRSSSGYRKTVSFDLLDYSDRKTNGSDCVEYPFNKSKTCAVISDARLENFGNNNDDFICDFVDTKTTNIGCTSVGLRNIDQGELQLDLSHMNSASSSSTKSSDDDVMDKNPLILRRTDQAPLKKCTSSLEIRLTAQDADMKKFGDGKVKVLAKYFEQKSLIRDKSKSSPELNMKKEKKLSKLEQSEILAQLKEWSLFGSSGREITPRETAKHEKCNTWNSEPSLNDADWKFNNSTESSCLLRKPRRCDKQHYVNTAPSINSCYKSCPNLYQRPPQIHFSPCHSSKFMTLRKLKRNCKQRVSGLFISQECDAIEPR